MYTLAYPYFLLLIVFPLLMIKMFPPYSEPRQAILIPWFERVANLAGATPAQGAVVAKQSFFQITVNWLLWLLVCCALARPQYLEPPVEQVIPTRDIALIVDLSGSMETTDFANAQGSHVDRLTAVKEVLDDFLTRRKGDRVGLIVFGNAPFVQVPFTEDLEACRLLLAETAVRMAGPRTAFGDAIGLAITLFEQSEVKEKVVIALTDGNDTGSKVPPAEAAKIARDNEILIHVIGVGDPAAVGEEKLDEDALKSVAVNTGGRYFHAADRGELGEIYTELDRISAREVESISYRPRIDLFHVPLGLFLMINLIWYGGCLLLQLLRKRRSQYG